MAEAPPPGRAVRRANRPARLERPSNRISSAADDAIDGRERRAPTPSCFTRITKSCPDAALRAVGLRGPSETSVLIKQSARGSGATDITPRNLRALNFIGSLSRVRALMHASHARSL